MGPLTARGLPFANSAIAPPAEASVGGLDVNEDPVAIREGRMVDPRNPDEIVVDAASARTLGYHVGEEISVGWVTNAQSSSGNFNPNQPIPVHQRALVKIVGITDGQATTLFQDQDNANGQSIMLFTPALTNKLLACCSNDMVSALTLQGGDRHLSAVEAAVKRALPKGLPFVYQESQNIIATANATLRPETIALNVFGGITGIATLLIAGQVISRRVRLRAPDSRYRPSPRSGPTHVPVGRTPRLARRPVARFVARRPRGGGPVASRAPGASAPLRRGGAPSGLDSDRSGRRNPGRGPGRRSRAGIVPLPARPRPKPRRSLHVFTCHVGGYPDGPPSGGGHRRALRARAGCGTECGARPVRHPGCHSGGHRGGRDGDLRVEPQHPRVAPGPLRLELELRHGRGRGPRRHPGPGRGQAAQCGSAGAILDRHLLLRPRTRRDERARHGRDTRSHRCPSSSERSRPAGAQPGRPRCLHAALTAQAARGHSCRCASPAPSR